MQKLKELATKTTSTLKDVVVDGGMADNNGFANAVNHWTMIEYSIAGEVFKLRTLRDDIITRLNNMRADHPKLALLLELRYINLLKWDDVAHRMSYEMAYARALRPKALQIFENYMDAN